jgi:hypothetical protein
LGHLFQTAETGLVHSVVSPFAHLGAAIVGGVADVAHAATGGSPDWGNPLTNLRRLRRAP